jgi:hypothetical protein
MPAPRKRHSATYRSGLEEKVGAQLEAAGWGGVYESRVIPYTTPATPHRYTPDFPLTETLIVETKGIFDAADRKKHLLIKAQHPELDIRFVFTRAKAPICKGSKTTVAMWCEANGFKWAEKLVPPEWLREASKKH